MTQHFERRGRGVCVTCPRKAEDGKSRCRKCHKKVLAAQRAKRKANKQAGRCPCGWKPIKGQRWCKKCRSSIRESHRKWRVSKVAAGICSGCPSKVTSGRLCPKCRKRYRDRHRQLRLEVFNVYGGAFCACCKIDYFEFLEIDHINGDGGVYRKTTKNRNIYGWLKARGFPPGYRVLCANCNRSRGHYGYCPHEREMLK
jgi:hypothetical protein